MIKNKRPEDLLLSLSSHLKKFGSPDVMFTTTINRTYYFRRPQGCPQSFGHTKIQMQLNKKEEEHNPQENGRCGAMVNLPVGCFSNVPPYFSTFGKTALNTT